MKIEISKGKEIIDAEEVFKKVVKKFSHTAHLILPARLVEKEVIVIVPKQEMTIVKTAPVTKKKNGTWKIGKVKK